MRRLIAFFLLSMIKIISTIFYHGEFKWLNEHPKNPWDKTRLMVLMNHTSLYEPLFIQALSFSFLWHLSAHLNLPGADTTLNRPIVGRFWKLLVPNIVSISRKKDDTWTHYLNTIDKKSVIIIAPEGRMKRPNGLDKDGKPMTVKGGIFDILEALNEGGMVLTLSGGLHHVQAPGQLIPRFFKTIKMNFVYIDIPEYKKRFKGDEKERKLAIVKDLQDRLEKDCPN